MSRAIPLPAGSALLAPSAVLLVYQAVARELDHDRRNGRVHEDELREVQAALRTALASVSGTSEMVKAPAVQHEDVGPADLCTVVDVAHQLGVSERQARNLMQAGLGFQKSGVWLASAHAVAEHLAGLNLSKENR